MGSFAGAPNMNTGRTEPMREQPYDEWLMEMLIEHGTAVFHGVPHIKGVAGMAIGHLESLGFRPEVDSEQFRLTNKASRYLDIMNKETE